MSVSNQSIYQVYISEMYTYRIKDDHRSVLTETITCYGGDMVANSAFMMCDRYPYSFGAGNNQGSTVGLKQMQEPYCDDTQVVGFDCSGLVKYAVYRAIQVNLPHSAKYIRSNINIRRHFSSTKRRHLVL